MKRPKRKIEDLKPNECIHIRTEKEAKRISKLKGTKKFDIFRAFDTESINTAYFPTDNHTFGDVNDAIRFEWVVYPASDFLPKKKSKTANRLDGIEKRLEAIENLAKEINNTAFDEREFQSKYAALHEKPFVLPENFYVIVDKENKDILYKWLLSKGLTPYKGYLPIGGIAGIVKYNDGSFGAGWNLTKLVSGVGYDFGTEITTEQFIEHVLKSDVESVITDVASKLEVGKWYKNDSGCLFCYTETTQSLIDGYGFTTSGDWVNPQENNFKHPFYEATPSEVEQVLIKEAERRGFKEGITFSLNGIKASLKIGNRGFGYSQMHNHLFCNETSQVILENGKWAEIIEQPKILVNAIPANDSGHKGIDFSVAGQLVEGDSNKNIVMTLGESNVRRFRGVILYSEKAHLIGTISNNFVTAMFSLYKGNLTLKNN